MRKEKRKKEEKGLRLASQASIRLALFSGSGLFLGACFSLQRLNCS